MVELRDELIADLRRDIDRSKEDSIVGYRMQNQTSPLWVAMEVLSLGSVSKMFRLLDDQTIRFNTARGFGYPNERFAESVFHSLTVLRNVCAHHARLWHRTNLQIAPRVLNRLKTDPDQSIYQSTPWAWLVVLADLVDTVQQDNAFSRRLWAYVSTRPDLRSGLQHPRKV